MATELPRATVSAAQRPDSIKYLRACKTCKLVKTSSQFHAVYCENCEHTWPDVHTSAARTDYVESHTTTDFEGMLSIVQHSGSWVARWLEMNAKDDGHRPFVPGVYAISLPMEEARAAEPAAVSDGDASDDVDEPADAVSGSVPALLDSESGGSDDDRSSASSLDSNN
jgi:hypothetical protein